MQTEFIFSIQLILWTFLHLQSMYGELQKEVILSHKPFQGAEYILQKCFLEAEGASSCQFSVRYPVPRD